MQRYVCIFSKLLSNKRVDFALLSRNELHIEDTSSKMDHVFRTFCHTITQLSTEETGKRLKYQGGSVFSDIR